MNKEEYGRLSKEIIEYTKSSHEEKGESVVLMKGSLNPDVLFIGEALGREEDKLEEIFIGRSGKMLDKYLKECNRYGHFNAVINTVPYMPLKDKKIRKPYDSEILHFLNLNCELIYLLKPKIIFLLGDTARKLYNYMSSNYLEFNNYITDNKNRRICCLYHPAYYLRRGEDGFNDFDTLYRKVRVGV